MELSSNLKILKRQNERIKRNNRRVQSYI
jgi:hypothetical protein